MAEIDAAIPALPRALAPRARVSVATISIAVVALAGWTTSCALALAGRIPLAAGVATDAAFAYLGWTVIHEAAHGNVGGGRRWIDALVGWPCTAIFYAPFSPWRTLHLNHHRHLNDPSRDPDAWVRGANPLAIAARCATILPRYYATFFLIPRAARSPLWSTVGFQLACAAVLVIAAAHGKLVALLALWPLAAMIASAPLAFLVDWLPHRPHRADAPPMEATRVARFPGSVWLTLGQTYHRVHHLWPAVPFHDYAQVDRAMFGQ